MESQGSTFAGGKRPGTTDVGNRPNKKSRTRQGLKFREIVALPIEDTTTISQQVQAWINFYKKDHSDSARVELFNLILEACGLEFSRIDDKVLAYCYPVRKITLPDLHIEDVRHDMINLISTSSVRDYETLQKEFPHLKHHLKEFCRNFIMRSQNEPFFFHTLKDCMDYMTTLSCHLPSGYNKSATWMALETISSLVAITTIRHDEGKIDQHLKDLEQKVIQYFQGFFLRVYKDNDQEIQRSCLEELKKWNRTYPSIFSNAAYQECLQDSKKIADEDAN